MLTTEQKSIIKSTAPILKERGTEITSRFYQQLFTSHPELLNLFNQTNQKKGRQQTALAGAVYAAAENIDQLEDILPVVKQIGHKHRSIGVRPEHYPIVGEHLLLAMKEVLGSDATDDVLEAWKEAYGVIASVFIEVEEEMYQDASIQQGGWEGFKPFRVTHKVTESNAITSFYLEPVDGNVLPSFSPGQYISVQLQIEGETYTHIRQYSLSDAPNQNYFRISVKKESDHDPEGIVSNHLHERVEVGDEIPVSAPAGDFVLSTKDETPLVLISGGVGLTPLLSMLKTVVHLQPERRVTFIHAARNSQLHALKGEVTDLVKQIETIQNYTIYSDPTEQDEQSVDTYTGHITLEWLQEILPHNQMEFYFCGPTGFMNAVYSALQGWNVPEDRMHYEFFGPAKSLETINEG
ncbi:MULTISPECIES: NO-inducible flavohemoprotein [Pontibacillus]|uniref:Flavohemoprotein n=1 Tax=Pontibacillus chungwhensis TaxID=265426 RepID=A0ABY8US58_9BACI|nr:MULTISPECIES: NO-inducible flavohemoprotein [Pontibacillus]MCD5322860.1 NO-inducible flavohemoprotein [Pontibacillus sp. HN14]WIF96258.1 NO-inducible flavohemoprotein [Pontibacillus chungwhensis]